MTFRQVLVCLFIGPLCAFFLAGTICLSPMFLLIGLLLGDDDPIRTTWQIVTDPPIGIFKGCYIGIGRAGA